MESQNLPGNQFQKTIAELLVIPDENDMTISWEELLEPLANASEFNVIDIGCNDNNNCYQLNIEYKKDIYSINASWYEFCFEEGFVQHQLSSENIKALKQATKGIKFSMFYTADAQISIHLLLKVICYLVPKLIGVFNCNSYMMLSPIWAKNAASAITPPAPDCLYTIHSVYKNNHLDWLPFNKSNYWLHTHGLNCCGIPDLEIIGKISKKHYDIYSKLIYHLVNYVISDDILPAEKESLQIGSLDNNEPIVVTWLPWKEGLKSYKNNILGGIRNRDEFHNQNTGIIFIYHSEKSCDKQNYSLITSIKESAWENPLLFYTTKETQRLNDMAHEQLSYLIEGLQKEESSAIAKIRITGDNESNETECKTNREHIWFKIEKITADSVTGILMQEPYYVKNMHEGSTGTYSTCLITDWKLYCDGQVITPDTTYLLDLQV